MKFKPNKKILISLFPCFLLPLMLPLLFFNGPSEPFFDNILFFPMVIVAVIVYLIFNELFEPFYQIFMSVGLAKIQDGGFFSQTIITFWGLIILALIYSLIIYLAISISNKFIYFAYKNKNKKNK